LNTDKLEYIVEIAKVQSLSAAAKNLHISQSALSQIVNQLEDELEMTLFTRSKKGAIPTFQGNAIISKANEMLEKVQEFYHTARLYQSFEGELRIAAIPGIMPILVQTVASYKNDYPNIQVSMVQRSTQEIIEDVRKHKIEAGLIAMSSKYQNEISGLTFEPIVSGEVEAIVSKDSPIAEKSFITAADMKRYPFVLYNDDYIKEFVQSFTEQFGAIEILFTTDNGDAIRSFTSSNLGISVGHNYSLIFDPYVTSGEIVVLKIKDYAQEPVQFGWIRAKNTRLSHEVKKFIDDYTIMGHGRDGLVPSIVNRFIMIKKPPFS